MAQKSSASATGKRKSQKNSSLKKSRVAKLRQLYVKSVDTYDGHIVDGRIPREELAVIKRNIRERVARQRRQTFIWAFIFFMIFLLGIGLLLWMSR